MWDVISYMCKGDMLYKWKIYLMQTVFSYYGYACEELVMCKVWNHTEKTLEVKK